MMRKVSRSSPRGFTLIELLMVVAIIAIMVGLLIPATVGFASTTRLVTGGNMVQGLTSMARQRAASNNTLTALVLLGSHGCVGDYRNLVVAEYRAGEGWFPISEWQTLPEGIIVDASNTQESSFLLNSPSPFPFYVGNASEGGTLPFDYHGQPVTAGAYAARIFLPSGRLLDSEVPTQIRLVEGYLQGTDVVYSQKTTHGTPANYYDVTILGASNTTKVSRPQ